MSDDFKNKTHQKRLEARKNMHIKSLRKRLSWLTNKIFVADKQNNPFSETLTVSFLPD